MTNAVSLDIALPAGYLELPLHDIEGGFTQALESASERAPAAFAEEMEPVLGSVALILDGLMDNGTRFCGVGRHSSPDEAEAGYIVSWLIVSVYEFDDTDDPRLLLVRQATEWADAAESGTDDPGKVVLTDLGDRPVMLREHTLGPPAPLYQVQAVVPADDGSAVAVIDLSTRSTASGPDFRALVVEMTRSVRFHARPIGDLIGL